MASLEVTVNNGKKYITVVYRGSEYTLYELCGDWFVSTRRKALGKSNAGSGKYFKTLDDVSKNCKAFGCVENLINAVYGVDLTANA